MRVEEITPACYQVEGDSGHHYTVYYNPRTRRWVCTCPDSLFRARTCKHIKAVMSAKGGKR